MCLAGRPGFDFEDVHLVGLLQVRLMCPGQILQLFFKVQVLNFLGVMSPYSPRF